ncbi:putative DNA-directed RNA polymerase [Ascobolus immersus RN42]|uniref:DNA-directed RNA polymerases I and III subunit RPAC2 n=1 Tax=Ascobolus immersus RN42 TaxID=1160509 RepID=A0A3N4ISF0_ASCIM|nr:putative DNA-directed RNA polymerase [Ascobolus immersus RN42]
MTTQDVEMSENVPQFTNLIQDGTDAEIRVLPGAAEDGSAASFEILNEDHTLGNSLRYVIMKNPEVEFCGYSIPHPSEDKINIRIQTYGKVTAIEALKKGLDDLMDLCDVVSEKFTAAKDAYGKQAEDE